MSETTGNPNYRATRTSMAWVTGASVEVNKADKLGLKETAQPDYEEPKPKKAPVKK